MLVLSRNAGEVIQVGDGALIVLEVRGGKVRLGLDFPDGVRIVRSEITALSLAGRRVLDAHRAYTDRES